MPTELPARSLHFSLLRLAQFVLHSSLPCQPAPLDPGSLEVQWLTGFACLGARSSAHPTSQFSGSGSCCHVVVGSLGVASKTAIRTRCTAFMQPQTLSACKAFSGADRRSLPVCTHKHTHALTHERTFRTISSLHDFHHDCCCNRYHHSLFEGNTTASVALDS